MGSVFLLFVCAAVGTFGGYLILLSYKRYYSYLDGICAMIGALKQNLSYKKDSVPVVLSGLNIANVQLKKNIQEYICFASGTGSKELSRGFLPQETFDCVNELFDSIGGSDESTQGARLDALLLKFEKLREAAENKYRGFGGMAVKLGFLIGLAIGVLAL